MKLTESHINAAKKCIGMDKKKPTKRNGKKTFKTDNELYEVVKDSEEGALFVDLWNSGYVNRWIGTSRGFARYNMTEKGLDWLSKETDTKITEKACKD